MPKKQIQKTVKVTTPDFRVSYPSVFETRRNDLSGKDEYSLQALFPKGTNLSKLVEAVKEVANEKWGPGKRPKGFRSPFRKQDDREKDGKMPDGYEKGAYYCNFKSDRKPGLVDGQMQKILDRSEFYGGCYAIATVVAAAYDRGGNAGVSFWLNNVQKTKEGEPFGNRTLPEDDFAPIEQTAIEDTVVDPLA